MTRARAAAGLAAILTALLLQGTVIGPWAGRYLHSHGFAPALPVLPQLPVIVS